MPWQAGAMKTSGAALCIYEFMENVFDEALVIVEMPVRNGLTLVAADCGGECRCEGHAHA